MNKTVKVFYCYAQADGAWLDQLDKHLIPLKRLNEITAWSDCDIQAGKNWTQEIQSHLSEAGIILVLVSPDFIATDYCYDNQMQIALDRQKSGTAYVIPIILRPVMWEHTPLGKLQVLPPNKKAVSLWSDHDEALSEVAKGIRDVVKLLIPSQALSPNATRILDQMGSPVLGFACPKCRYINRLGAKFCARDGVQLQAGAVGAPPPRTRNQPASPPNPQIQQKPVKPFMPVNVELRYELGKDLIPINIRREIIHVLIEIAIVNVRKKLFVSKKNRSPLSLSIVIDHSSFMKGIKLESIKKAVEMVIDELEPTDYISVVVFADTGQVVIPSMLCNDKPGMKEAIHQISDTSGSATMSLGMTQGLNELWRWTLPNAVTSMILLANNTTQEDAERCYDLARYAAAEGIRIHPFGMSSSWDLSLLTPISQLSGGNAPVLLLPTTNILHTLDPGAFPPIPPIMRIHNALLTLTFPAGVSLRRAAQVTPTFAEFDRSQLCYSLGDLEESTLYEYLLELAITPQSSGTFHLARAELAYGIPLIGRIGEKESCDIEIHFIANQGQSAQINSAVMKKIFRFLSTLSKLRYILSKLR